MHRLLAALLVLGGAAHADPVLFGPGVISTGDYERDGSFTPDGKTFFFVKRTMWPGWSAIVYSRLIDGEWSRPEVAPFSGRWADTTPSVSPDGSRLVFASRRPGPGEPEKPRKDWDLWMVERTPAGWSEPRRLPFDTAEQEYSPSQTRDGAIYYCAGNQVMRVRVGGTPEPAFAPEPDDGYLVGAFVDPDETIMVEVVLGREDALHSAEGLYPRADLYVRDKKDGAWGPLRHLPAPINSAAEESSPMISPDGKTFYFTSERGVFTEHGTMMNADDLQRGLRSPGNGLGDIYSVDAAVLR
jgi:hypothetical protein